MIARVRRRVRANSLTVDKEKTAQSVCLLSAVLLLPYCPRGPLPLLPSPAPVLYSAFVLPVVLSANYRYPVPTLKTLAEAAKGMNGCSNIDLATSTPVSRFYLRIEPIFRLQILLIFFRKSIGIRNKFLMRPSRQWFSFYIDGPVVKL